MFRITRSLGKDNKMAAVHPFPSQDSLPPGWECRFDPRTGQYYFLNHLEHITTWEDPRLRLADQGSYAKYYLYGLGRPPSGPVKSYTPYYSGNYTHTMTPPPPPPQSIIVPKADPIPSHLANGGYSPNFGSPRTPYRFKHDQVQVDDRVLMKLCIQFPTVDEGHIWQLLKQYHNRENVVVSALLAEGQPRAQTHTVDLTPKLQRSEIAHTFQVDEAQYFKLRNFFPTADPDHIRNLQKIHNNQEHEVIAALVAGHRGGRHQSPHPSSPKMKLRYLKLVFPEADEAMLFDVLNNCDNNAQEASSRLVGMGYQKKDTPIARPTSSRLVRKPMTEVPLPTIVIPDRPHIVIPPKASEKVVLVKNLQDQFPAVSRTLVNMALDSSNYNEERAKQFLTAMTPQDVYRSVVPQIDTKVESSSPRHAAHLIETPTVPPRSRHSSVSSGSRHSSLDRHSLKGESSREGTPSKSPSHRAGVSSPARSISSPSRKVTTVAAPDKTFRQKFKRGLLKCLFRFSKSTSTQEEIEPTSKPKVSRARGADSSHRKGPCEKLLLKDYIPWMGSDSKNRKGPDPNMRRGPDSKNLIGRKDNRAKGPQAHRGALTHDNTRSR